MYPLFLPSPSTTVSCPEEPLTLIIQQILHCLVRSDDHITTVATISTIWTTIGNILFPPETNRPITTLSTPDLYLYKIEHLLSSMNHQ